MRALSIFLAVTLSCFAGHVKKEENESSRAFTGSGIRVLPVKKTPEPDNVSLRIGYPEEDQLLPNGKVNLNFRLRGFSLGTDSYSFPRASEIINSDLGQTVHIVIDNDPYFPYAGPSMDPFDEEGDFYQQNYRFTLPVHLSEGMHTLRMFLCRSFGESLKCTKCTQALRFFVKDRKINYSMNLKTPYLTYNEPSGYFKYSVNAPILLDFLIENCELSEDGYKVRLEIDDKVISDLDQWTPYYLYGLSSGEHTVRLQLLDTKGNVSAGAFNDVSRKIRVK